MRKSSFKKIIVLLLIISALSLSVSAQNTTNNAFDPTPSYKWLIEQCPGGYCDNDIMATAFYAMSVKLAGYGNTYGEQSIKNIKIEKRETESCFPKSSCNTKDTAMAYWALSNYGEDTAGIEDYIREKLGVGLTDNWWLEIITTAEDQTCKIGYPKDNAQEEKIIMVDAGKFPECNVGQPETFFDLNDCITPNLVNSNPALELTIDCSAIGAGTVISIVYNSGSSYYLTEQATAAKYKTQLQNACHKKGGSCDKDTSLWTNWVLQNKNSDINTNLYLLTKYDNLNPVDMTFLYLSTSNAAKKSSYLEQLIGLQKLDGSFNKNNFQTAVAILALQASGSTEELSQAIAYLESSRKNDGSWDGDETTTALVLYSAFSSASITLPPLTPLPGSTGGNDNYCGDNVCDPNETPISCAKDCSSTGQDCVENNICETDYETSVNCPSDCFCGDNICDDSENSANCAFDCETTTTTQTCGNDIREGSEQCDGSDDASCSLGFVCSSQCTCILSDLEDESSNTFIWIISGIIILLILVGGYFAYNKYTNNNKSRRKPSSYGSSSPTFKLPPSNNSAFEKQKNYYQRRGPPTNGSGKTKHELELEKSLKEAKKLLGGK